MNQSININKNIHRHSTEAAADHMDMLTHAERTVCAVENDGSLVIGEFVDERGVQFWSCRRESNCGQTLRLVRGWAPFRTTLLCSRASTRESSNWVTASWHRVLHAPTHTHTSTPIPLNTLKTSTYIFCATTSINIVQIYEICSSWGVVDSGNVKFKYSLRSMTSFWNYETLKPESVRRVDNI